jgi:hypothetical protein
LRRTEAVGFIDWLDGSPPMRFYKRLFMIELPLLFTGIQILPYVLINRIIAGFLVANVKICSTAIALTNADKFDSDIRMLPEEISAKTSSLGGPEHEALMQTIRAAAQLACNL